MMWHKKKPEIDHTKLLHKLAEAYHEMESYPKISFGDWLRSQGLAMRSRKKIAKDGSVEDYLYVTADKPQDMTLVLMKYA